MEIAFYVILTMSAIYFVFHIKDVLYWWAERIWTIPKGIWNLIKKLFGK